jgi:hypothetical protein
VHVNATNWLTLYCWHPKRGAEGIEAVGVVPRFSGRAMHDRWTSYDRYSCVHSLCGAHLIRDALFVAEQEKQPWAQAMVEHFRRMVQITNHWRAQGARHLPASVRTSLLAEYFAILAFGYASHTAQAPPPKSAGRKKQDPSKNLLDALLLRVEQVLAFLDDLSVPFTNNLAERDLRMSHPSNRRFRGPSAVPKGSVPFAPFAATSPPGACKAALCLMPCEPSLLALPSLSHGHLSSYEGTMPTHKKERTTPETKHGTLESSVPSMPTPEEFHRYLRAQIRGATRIVMEEVMREELERFVGAAWGECTPERKGYRNGFYTRDLATTSGPIEDLKVPRDREGEFQTQIFDRYSRYEQPVAEGLTQMFVSGTSTHKVGEVAQTLMGVAPSASTVSRLNQTLTEQFEAWRVRPLLAHYRILYLDGIHFTVRHGTKTDSTIILTDTPV